MKHKRIVGTILVILLGFMLASPVFADDPPGYSQMQRVTETSGNSKLVNAGNQVLGVIYAVGVVVSIATVMIIGIRYMMASPGDRADLKARAIPFLIGAFITFGAVNILKIVGQIGDWINQ